MSCDRAAHRHRRSQESCVPNQLHIADLPMLTMIDALSTLAVLGNATAFCSGARLIVEHAGRTGAEPAHLHLCPSILVQCFPSLHLLPLLLVFLPLLPLLPLLPCSALPTLLAPIHRVAAGARVVTPTRCAMLCRAVPQAGRTST